MSITTDKEREIKRETHADSEAKAEQSGEEEEGDRKSVRNLGPITIIGEVEEQPPQTKSRVPSRVREERKNKEKRGKKRRGAWLCCAVAVLLTSCGCFMRAARKSKVRRGLRWCSWSVAR